MDITIQSIREAAGMKSKSAGPVLKTAKPCPPWCEGSCEPSHDPMDGFMHSSTPEQLKVTGGSDAYPQKTLKAWVETWVPNRAADPPPGVITLSVNGTDDPSLSISEARELVIILNKLLGLAERGP